MIRFFFLFFIFFANGVYSQLWIDIHFNNTDNNIRNVHREITFLSVARASAIAAQNNMIRNQINSLREQLRLEYTKNEFDKEDTGIAEIIKQGGFSIGTSILGSFKDLPYMTNNKAGFMKSIAYQKALLLFLEKPNYSRVSASQRQQIYLLRRQLFKLYSKQDLRVIKLLGYSSLGTLIKNDKKLLDLLNLANFIL